MAEESLPAVSDETRAMLEDQVKKGKARKFILICKGAAIKSLVVFKKGPYGPKINQAKKEGFRGEAVVGVVTGKGVNLTFQLPGNSEVSNVMKTEGHVYEGEPCKTAKLRKFFLEEADLKFKPEFQLITKVSDAATVSELDDAEEEAVAETTTGEIDQSDRKQKLVEAFKKLTALIQQAIALQPENKAAIMSPAASIKELIQSDQLDQAKEELVAYAGMLKQIVDSGSPTGSSTPPAPPPPPSTSSSDSSDAKTSEWDWRLAELTPKLKEVLSKKLGDFGQIATCFKQAQAAKPTDLAAAVELLKQCAKLVEAALAATQEEESPASDNDYRSAWNDVSAEFAAQRSRVAQALPGQLSDFEQLLQQANNFASSENYFQAVQVAMKIAELDAEARRAGTAQDVTESIPEHIVEDRKKFVQSRWQDAVRASRIEIEKLEPVILAQVPDEDASQLVQSIQSALDDFVDEINAAIVGTQSASADNLKPLQRAQQAVISYRERIKSNPLIQHLKAAKKDLGADVKVEENLLEALNDLEAKLAG